MNNLKKDEALINEREDNRYDILPVLSEILKRLWIVIIIAVLCASALFIGGRLIVKPTYRSEFTAYINNQLAQKSKDSLTSSDISAAHQLVETYSQVLTSNAVLRASENELAANYTITDLKNMVRTEIKDNTEIISVSVVADSPEEAYSIASAIDKVSPGYMADIIEGSSMKIVDYPELNTQRYRPLYSRFAIVGFLIGAFFSILIIVIRFIRDDSVKNERDIENRFSIPMIGIIPDVNYSSDRSGYYYSYGEAYESRTKDNA